jgi:hypothetical protein
MSGLPPRPVGTNVGVGGVARSTSCGTTAVVGNLTVTLVTTGRPVFVFLTSDGTANTVPVGGGSSTASGAAILPQELLGPSSGYYTYRAVITLYRNGAQVAVQSVTSTTESALTLAAVPSSSYSFIDFPPAGTNTYTIGTGAAGEIYNSVLEAFEF